MFNLFPFTNCHDLNMDWIIQNIKALFSKSVFSVNNTKPDENGNVNLPTVAGVSSVNGIGADGSGNVQLNASDVGALPDSYTPPPAPVQSVNGQTGAVVLNASNVGAISSTEQVGYMTVDPYLTVLQAVNSYIEKGNSIAEIFFSGKANTQFPVGYEIVTSAPIPKTWFNFIGVKNNSSIISLRVTQSGSIATNEVISVDDTIYFHAIYMM